MGPMPIWTRLLKKWVGPDPEKHIGSTPLKYSAESDTDFSGIESRFFMFLTC